MRHARRGRKLSRTTGHRRALFRNQLAALVERERIITTLPKAKELRRIAERVVTRGRADTVQSRRWVRTWLQERGLVRKVFDDISPRFVDRPGGYTRIIKLGPRQGDGAELAVLEFIDFDGAVPPPAEEKPEAEKESGEKAAKKKAGKKKVAKKPAGEAPAKKAAPKKAAPKASTAKKGGPAKKGPAKKPSG